MTDLKFTASLLRQIIVDQVSDWCDVDDLFHGGFRDATVKRVGQLCGELARRMPGPIASYFSEKAIPYLQRLANELDIGRRETEQCILEIMQELDNRATDDCNEIDH